MRQMQTDVLEVWGVEKWVKKGAGKANFLLIPPSKNWVGLHGEVFIERREGSYFSVTGNTPNRSYFWNVNWHPAPIPKSFLFPFNPFFYVSFLAKMPVLTASGQRKGGTPRNTGPFLTFAFQKPRIFRGKEGVKTNKQTNNHPPH